MGGSYPALFLCVYAVVVRCFLISLAALLLLTATALADKKDGYIWSYPQLSELDNQPVVTFTIDGEPALAMRSADGSWSSAKLPTPLGDMFIGGGCSDNRLLTSLVADNKLYIALNSWDSGAGASVIVATYLGDGSADEWKVTHLSDDPVDTSPLLMASLPSGAIVVAYAVDRASVVRTFITRPDGRTDKLPEIPKRSQRISELLGFACSGETILVLWLDGTGMYLSTTSPPYTAFKTMWLAKDLGYLPNRYKALLVDGKDVYVFAGLRVSNEKSAFCLFQSTLGVDDIFSDWKQSEIFANEYPFEVAPAVFDGVPCLACARPEKIEFLRANSNNPRGPQDWHISPIASGYCRDLTISKVGGKPAIAYFSNGQVSYLEARNRTPRRKRDWKSKVVYQYAPPADAPGAEAERKSHAREWPWIAFTVVDAFAIAALVVFAIRKQQRR